MARQFVEHIEAPFLLALDMNSIRLTDEQFYQLCRDNEDLRLELTAEGELIIMPPTGGITGSRNSKINQQISNWADKDGTGLSFDSSTMFVLPNGAKRSPDAAWVKRDRWNTLTREEQESFVPLCPDFVLELRSKTDSLSFLQGKMEEYMANGARLGRLIDPVSRRVYVYSPDQQMQCLENPRTLAGDTVLHGFVLDLKDIF